MKILKIQHKLLKIQKNKRNEKKLLDFNKELEKEILEFHKTKDILHYDNILNILPYAILRTPVYLLEDPTINDKGAVVIKKDNTLLFNIIEDKEGNKYIPVFTSKEEYYKMPNLEEASIYHLQFHLILDIFKAESDILGIAINPVDQNIIIEKEILFAINEVLKSQ